MGSPCIPNQTLALDLELRHAIQVNQFPLLQITFVSIDILKLLLKLLSIYYYFYYVVYLIGNQHAALDYNGTKKETASDQHKEFILIEKWSKDSSKRSGGSKGSPSSELNP